MAQETKQTPWGLENRLPNRDEAAFAARVLASCNGHDLDVWTDENWPVDADEFLAPMLMGGGKTLPELLCEVERIWPGSFWHLAKGRVRSREPLFGFQVLFGTDEILAEGEGESAVSAISDALVKAGAA